MEKPDYQQLYQIAEAREGYFAAAQARMVGFTWERSSRNIKIRKFHRTLLDAMRSRLSPALVEEAVYAAVRRGLTSPQKLLAQAQKRSRHAWKSMRKILEPIS